MAAELQASQAPSARTPMKRKPKHGKANKPNKKQKPKAPKPNMKMQKLFRKRAKEYNSDEEEEEEDDDTEQATGDLEDGPAGSSGSEDEKPRDLDALDDDGDSDDEPEEDGAHHGVTKLAEGSRAFKLAFSKIMSKKLPNDPLGPILSAHQKLVAEKLAEEETDHKGNAAKKKLKLLAQEKGHVKPDSFLDSKEKYLISVATKGVVKLFNAVSKAQNPQKGLNPSKSKDAKVLAKRRKETFLSELKKSTGETFTSSKVTKSANGENNDEPGWAPLRDSYMLTSSKLKDWDKMTDTTVDDHDNVPMDSSSDDE